MSGSNYKVGMIVTHPKKPEWGPGEIVTVTETSVHIYFKNDAAEKTRSFNRIYPNGPIGWDAPGFDTTGEKMEADVYYFAKPDKIYSLNDLEKSQPPRCLGVYGWYFDKLPPCVRKDGCVDVKTGWWPFRTKWWLLYIGKAKNLKDRIMKYHIGGGHYPQGTMSSFRLSLGCLLSDKFGLKLYYPPESFGKKNEKLNKWLEKHARIAWIETTDIDATERRVIKCYILPLNYENNAHPLVQPLSGLRKAFRRIAQSTERKPKKKHFRKAYKKFVKECRSLGIIN